MSIKTIEALASLVGADNISFQIYPDKVVITTVKREIEDGKKVRVPADVVKDFVDQVENALAYAAEHALSVTDMVERWDRVDNRRSSEAEFESLFLS